MPCDRETWSSSTDYLTNLLGFCFGLNNVWKFPFLCYKNGGGAFLIPFFTMYAIIGIPVMYHELALGQLSSQGPVALYRRFCPLLRGLGQGMVVISTLQMLYYNIFIGWIIHYIAVSILHIFEHDLPWQRCNNTWNSDHCYSHEEAASCEANNGTMYGKYCFNATFAAENNISGIAKEARRLPAEDYFMIKVLDRSSGIEETGYIKWDLAAVLAIAWLVSYLFVRRAIHSSAKVAPFFAVLPHMILAVMFIYGVTLPGAETGIAHLLTPDFEKIKNMQVWVEAAGQVLLMLNPACGGLTTLSSYRKFTSNHYMGAFVVAGINILATLIASVVTFAYLGFLAQKLDVEVPKVVEEGHTLVFIVYPEVVARLPRSPLWSFFFFVMFFCFGIDSQFVYMETLTTAILNGSSSTLRRKPVTLYIAAVGFVIGLIFTCKSGIYWMLLLDKYAANWSVLTIAVMQCIVVGWIYGADQFCHDIQRMIGRRGKPWVIFWSVMWKFITPASLLYILLFNVIHYTPLEFEGYVYPPWAYAVGFAVDLLPIAVVVVMAGYQVYCGPDDLTLMQRVRMFLHPSDAWSPANARCGISDALSWPDISMEQRVATRSPLADHSPGVSDETSSPDSVMWQRDAARSPLADHSPGVSDETSSPDSVMWQRDAARSPLADHSPGVSDETSSPDSVMWQRDAARSPLADHSPSVSDETSSPDSVMWQRVATRSPLTDHSPGVSDETSSPDSVMWQRDAARSLLADHESPQRLSSEIFIVLPTAAQIGCQETLI